MRVKNGDELFLPNGEESLILRAVPHNKDRTNADRIRSMSDEGLAAMLYSFEDLNMPDYCQRKKECDDMLDADIDIPSENCRRCLVDWLRQPVEEAQE